MGVHLGEGIEPEAVGQRKIEQHQPGAAGRQVLEPERQAIGGVQHERRARVLGDHLEDEPRVARVVLDEEDVVHYLPCPLGGSVTTVSQKTSIDFTTTMNFSRSTGLVT